MLLCRSLLITYDSCGHHACYCLPFFPVVGFSACPSCGFWNAGFPALPLVAVGYLTPRYRAYLIRINVVRALRLLRFFCLVYTPPPPLPVMPFRCLPRYSPGVAWRAVVLYLRFSSRVCQRADIAFCRWTHTFHLPTRRFRMPAHVTTAPVVTVLRRFVRGDRRTCLPYRFLPPCR